MYKVFDLLGTPTARSFAPGTVDAASIATFPRQGGRELSAALPAVPADAISLLGDLLRYNQLDRITAVAAQAHPYLREVRKADA